MRALDKQAAEKYAMPTLLLMENAGRAVAWAVRRLARAKTERPIVVFCGGGNNGGDGLAAARYLFNAGYEVRLLIDRRPERLQGDALIQWNAAKSLKIPFRIFHSRKKLLQFTNRPLVVVDALLGTGFHGPVRESTLPIIESINSFKSPVVSVDVPSGLDADSGLAPGAAVRARMTVTLGLPKTGLLRPQAKRFTGELLVADIGFPLPLVRRFIKRV